MVLNSTDSILLNLIKIFLRRQELVYQVIGDIRPWVLDADKKYQLTKEEAKKTAQGHWKINEWQFKMHGPGCKIINTTTKEPINWDPPNLYCFDLYFFLEWLEWCGQQKETETLTKIYCEDLSENNGNVLLEKLDHFVSIGLLKKNPDCFTKYTLM